MHILKLEKKEYRALCEILFEKEKLYKARQGEGDSTSLNSAEKELESGFISLVRKIKQGPLYALNPCKVIKLRK